MNESERGFTLIEVMIVAALSAFLLIGAFEAVRLMLASSRTVVDRTAQYSELETLANRLITEARTAEAVTIPDLACPAVEFYTRDPGQAGAPHFWSYRYDAAAKTIVRNTDTSGPLATCSVAGGTIVAQHVSAFATTPLPMAGSGGLAGRSDTPYITASGATNVRFPLGIDEADGSTPIVSGNGLIEVTVRTAVGQRTVDLAPGVTPSGYTLTLQYTCNARCNPAVPHDGARINACTAVYGFQAPTTQAYVTHTTLIHPTDPPPLPLWPPNIPTYESFAYPDTWEIAGYFDFHYTGADTRDQIVPFTVRVSGDPNNPGDGGPNAYYPAFVAPRDANTSATYLIAHIAGLPQSAIDQSSACNALNTAPVYTND